MANATKSPKVCTPAIRSSSTAGCSFSSCKASERSAESADAAVARGVRHESHRGVVAAAAAARAARDVRADRRGMAFAATPAGRCVSGSVAADRRSHHAMAGTFDRGSRTADHRAARDRHERHAEDDDGAFDFAVRFVRRRAHLRKRNRQLFRASASAEPLRRCHLAERRDAVAVAAVVAVGSDLSLRAAKCRPLADGTEDVRRLGRRAAIQIRAGCRRRFGIRRRRDAVSGAARSDQDRGRRICRSRKSKRRSPPTTATPAADFIRKADSSITCAASAASTRWKISATSFSP